MRNIGFVLLAVSVLLGALTIWGLRHMSAARAEPDAKLHQTTVVVATRPIGFGEALTPELLRVQAWPKDAQPQGSFQTVAQVTAQRRVALGPIAANEPLLVTRISGPGGRATLSGVIRVGMRATTIRVNDVFGVAGFVLPGDFVDILITREDGDRNANQDDKRTDVLLRSVRVLAVDQLANQNKNDPVVAKAATIEVTPEQAQKLALAAEVGTLSLALRGTVDPLSNSDEGGPPTVRTADLRLDGFKPPAPAARPVRKVIRTAPRRTAPASPTIEIFRGAEATSTRVPSVG
ncbi:Flp pilus assembly protein CpaB [Phenylobacterium sp. LjRoot225]|uniref:Flp pilus assembly protein CpaB n=1 Tax=Phenylobacterium sp. LjRoot225 TaxID=3342285 RepID=UPI003ED04A86